MNTNIPTFWWHVAQVVFLLVILGAVTFSIVRTTKKESLVVQKDGVVNYLLKDAQIKPGFGGCATINLPKLEK